MRGRSSPFKPRPRRSWRAPGELLNFTLYFLCAVLLVLSRIGHDAVMDVRDRFVDLTAPLLEAASMPGIMGRHALARARSYIALADEMKPEGKIVEFMAPTVCMCSTMQRIDPQHLAWTLENLAEGNVVNRITVPAHEAELARLALDRMLAVS